MFKFQISRRKTENSTNPKGRQERDKDGKEA